MKQRLLQPGDTIIVAISGGADSTALLDLLARLPGYDLTLIAAHLNHSLRGSDSEADEEFCRTLADSYRIPFVSRRVDVRGLAESGQLNLEDAGRRARIAFLDETREKHGAAAVALAHHADDQAETVLINFLRGSGMVGLSGMMYRNARGYIRPLLEITRAEIMCYLSERKLGWREDASNSDATFLRNRIRHQLLPILEGYNPSIRSTLAATASILADDEALLDELTEQAFSDSCQMEEDTVVCDAGRLRMLKLPLRRRVLRRMFRQLTGTVAGLGQRHIKALCDMIDSERQNSRLSLPQSVTAARSYDRISLLLKPESVPDSTAPLLVKAPGHHLLPTGGSLTIEISEFTDDFNAKDANEAFFDLGKNPFPWRVRTFLPGDRMIPFGMSGRKKVKDMFIDQKIPASKRRRIPLLFCGTDLIWIPGVAVSELCRVHTHSTATIRAVWHP